ncbi:hypothetical protein [Micromonospora sp. NBRC 101691]|uniref:hypothetical protein n=1 Tax=Micromonospora sp. NBRC 101691 TaxID=3032198 RepID=UPI0024A4F67B|nr:hypothetical protein [Micromonospora sp. NBRC 101691]GLY22037.1 hypothetical protein Misp04_17690 [Micromonospora sp. NBRC 101691]
MTGTTTTAPRSGRRPWNWLGSPQRWSWAKSARLRHGTARHEKATTRDGWRWLPAEHRAAHLIDAARAYLQADDPVNAGRVLMEADRIAPAEIRHRPAGRDVLAQVAHDPDAPTTLTHLAATLGVG